MPKKSSATWVKTQAGNVPMNRKARRAFKKMTGNPAASKEARVNSIEKQVKKDEVPNNS